MEHPFLQLSSHFFNPASLANTYYVFAFSLAFSFSVVPPLGLKGLGPNSLIFLSNSIAVSLNFEPSAELQNSILILSGSNPTALRTSVIYSVSR